MAFKNRVRISRSSTCGSLGLPEHLACRFCKKSIYAASQSGMVSRIIKKCIKPFAERWVTHREVNKVKVYNDIHEYLGYTTNDENEDLIENDLENIRTIVNYDNATLNTSQPTNELLPTLHSALNTSQPTNELLPTLHSADEVTPSISNIEEQAPTDTDSEDNTTKTTPNLLPKLHKQRGSSNKCPFEIEVPITHTIIHLSRLKQLKQKANKYDALMSNISKNKYHGQDDANTLIGYAASIVPQCGYAGLATIIPFIVASFLTNAGIPFLSHPLISSMPSPQTIQSLVTEHAIDTSLLMLLSINLNPYVFIALDKGNKKGNKNLAKFLCWYDTVKEIVRTYLIDVDCVDEHTTDVFDGFKHSIDRFFSPNGDNNLFSFCGQCTDSGGGGTLHALARLLERNNMIRATYLIASCTLHNLQTALRNAVVNVLGEGGTDDNGEYRMNVMQLLHGAYNLQNWHEIEELKEIWTFVQTLDDDELTFKKLEEPVLTRWWLVGACAASFKESMHVWKKICVGIRNSAKSTSASMKIASCTLHLINKPVIVNDLELLVAFHEAFLFPHFKFLQLGDPRTGTTASFLSRHITIRYFLMMEDLESMENNKWMSHVKFTAFKSSLDKLNDIEKEQQKKKITLFLGFIRRSIEKHFSEWTSRLFFLGIWSDQPMAKVFARTILGNVEDVRSELYFCKFHKRYIDLPKFNSFIRSKVSDETIMQTRALPCIQNNAAAVQLVSIGVSLWECTTIKPLQDFRTLFLYQYSSLPTNTQFVERGVKESGYVTLGRRAETNRTILAIARGKVLPEALKLGHAELDNLPSEEDEEVELVIKKKRQLKGKRKSKHLMSTILSHIDNMEDMKKSEANDNGDIDYLNKRKRVRQLLTTSSVQFKRERINKKVQNLRSNYHNNPAPNQYQRREGYTLTPLMEGRIQYGLLLKTDNADAVRDELLARGVDIPATTGWMVMINMLKENENKNNASAHRKYFVPTTPYNNFVVKGND